MYKRILIITMSAIGLSFLASSCVKEKGFEDRVKDIVSVKLDSLNKHVTVLEKTQTALNDSLKNIKGDVEELSKQSKDLTDSIAALKDSLAAQKKWTEAGLKTIGDKVTELETKQSEFKAEVYKRLDHLWNRIQKIDVVPTYSDGSVDFGKGDNVLNFVVRPDSVAKKLAAAHPTGDSTFSFVVVQTLTKAATMDTLSVKRVEYVGGILSVTVKDENGKIDPNFYKGEQSYSGCLLIGDGNSDNTSGFFPLSPVIETANCYIISEAGTYKIKAVKGNSKESVGTVSSVSVLWESYGTSETITAGALIKSDVSYADGYITFTTGSSFPTKKGNAVIAAKDASNNVLWSWHIWLTDQPEEQAYKNSAGTMLDRNLGATSATKGDVSALGLLYQWGRKDPFLGAAAIFYESGSTPQQTESTLVWPSAVAAGSTGGSPNLSYSIKNPTTYITNNLDPYDWYCSGSQYKNDTLWVTRSGKKTIYDPCPVGYRVPDGGYKASNGVWAKAFGTDDEFTLTGFAYGFDFGATTKTLVSSGTCWYPAAGYRNYDAGSLSYVGNGGDYWSCTPGGYNAYCLGFSHDGGVYPSFNNGRALGYSVRCLKEE